MADKVYIFDMDGTLCDSQERVPEELVDILRHFAYPVVAISGTTKAQIEKQISFPAALLPQNGNEYFKSPLSDEQKERILAHVTALRETIATLSVLPTKPTPSDRGVTPRRY